MIGLFFGASVAPSIGGNIKESCKGNDADDFKDDHKGTGKMIEVSNVKQEMKETNKSIKTPVSAGFTNITATRGQSVTSRSNDQIYQDVAYSSLLDEYLVVWEEEFSVTDHDIYARRIADDGTSIGAEFSIALLSNYECHPAVAYNHYTDEYLVVWEHEFSATDHDIYARRVAAANNTLMGTVIAVTTLANDESNPDVAYNPDTGEFFVVWEQEAGLVHDIYGQRIIGDGLLAGGPIQIAGSSFDEREPAVASNSDNGQFFVVWQETMFAIEDNNISGQRVTDDGSLYGDEISLCSLGNDQVKPSVAYNSGSDEFLVVWEEYFSGIGDIYGQRVNANTGDLVGGWTAISWVGTNYRGNPDVCYKEVVNEFLVTWEYAYSEGDCDVYCRRVKGDGSLPSDEIPVSIETSNECRPVVVSDDSWSYFVVWMDDRTAETTGWDLYGTNVDLYRFSGRVFEGDVGDEGWPLEGVTVELYGSNNAGSLGNFLDSTVTVENGWYALFTSDVWEYYNLLETDPDGYSSAGATSSDGSVVTVNWIQFTYPLDDKSLLGNKFWDRSIVLPDLIVTDIWYDTEVICYQVRNIGEGIASGVHHTALHVDGVYQMSDVVPVALSPGERWNGCFDDYTWDCTLLDDTLTVTGDYMNTVVESNETNNNREELWTCDTVSPMIVYGPVVHDITQSSAVVHWETDEACSSLVAYGSFAGRYPHEAMGADGVSIHEVILSDLEPSTTYHGKVYSMDESGNTVVSRDVIFETLPLEDSVDPMVTIVDPGECAGMVTLYAEGSDNNGVEKVIFSIDDEPLYTDFFPPYKVTLATDKYVNGAHDFQTKIEDFSGRSSTDQIPLLIANLKDEKGPEVTIVYPYDQQTVKGWTWITAYVKDDVHVQEATCYVDGVEKSSKTFPKPTDYIGFSYVWDTYDVSNGKHTIAVNASDGKCNYTIAAIVVWVNNPPIPQPNLEITKHEVFRHGHVFAVEVTVKNAGKGDAEHIEIHDSMKGFQPISRSNFNMVNYSAEYDPSSKAATCVIADDVSLAVGSSRTYYFSAVPVLTYSNPPQPSIGDAMNLSYEGKDGTKHFERAIYSLSHITYTAGSAPKAPLATAHEDALKEADYLIVTNPSLLMILNPFQREEVNGLLSDMAELAFAKHGVLGYLTASTETIIRNLLRATTQNNWATKLHPNFTSSLKGYLLLVGETEILPARNEVNFDVHWSNGPPTTFVDYSDHPYTDTNNDGKPDLIVGRIIGNNASDLRRVIQSSIGGYGFDRSDALVVSGTDGNPDYQALFTDGINTTEAKLKGKGFTTAKIHWSSFTSDAARLASFRTNATDKDVICYNGHGNIDTWASGLTTGDFPVNFGTENPFILSLACRTGNYEAGDDENLAEAFFDSDAAVFIGSTQDSSINVNGDAGSWFFENWNTDETIGKVFTQYEQKQWTSNKQSYGCLWVWEYNLYGDPKFGTLTSTLEQATSRPTARETPLFFLDVEIPAYTVTSLDGLDYVEIPGGDLLLEEGSPQLPSYTVMVDYPRGYQVQNVALTSKSGLVTQTGLTLPLTLPLLAVPKENLASSSSSEEWYPTEEYHWEVVENSNGTTSLAITIYPFSYNPLTTNSRFYDHYTFDIAVVASPVTLVSLTTDKDDYPPGDTVVIEGEINVSGEPQDVIISGLIKQYGSDEITDGLPLSTLGNVSGLASFSAEWDSTSFAPGDYTIELSLWDTESRVLDRTTRGFRVGFYGGNITEFTVTPQYFDLGDIIEIHMIFTNNGSLPLTGTAVITIIDESGSSIQEFTHDIIELAPLASVNFNEQWDTSEGEDGSFQVLGYVLYEGRATMPRARSVMTNMPPEAAFTYTPDSPLVIGQLVSFDSSLSYDGDGSITAYDWDFGDGNTSADEHPSHSYSYVGYYPVHLMVTDNKGDADSTTAILEVFESTDEPPIITDENPVTETHTIHRPPEELNVTIWEPEGNVMDVLFWWKDHTGSWEGLTMFSSIGNGTYGYMPPYNNDWIWGNTTYTWSVNATDGTSWTNRTFTFTTGGSRYDVNNDDKVNFIDAGIVWVHRTTNAVYDGLYDVNEDGKVNFVDAGKTWVNRD